MHLAIRSFIFARRRLSSFFIPPMTISTIPDLQDNMHYSDLIFGPIDLDNSNSSTSYPWDHYPDVDPDIKPSFLFPSYDYAAALQHQQPSFFDSTFTSQEDTLNPAAFDDLATWINDPDLNSPSSPIAIPSPLDSNLSSSSSYLGYHDQFSQDAAFSPATFAAMHPLPRSMSPPSSFEEGRSAAMRPRVQSVVSPRDVSMHAPTWASQIYDPPSAHRTQNLMTRPSIRHSPMTDTTLRQRMPIRRASLSSSGLLFQSSSAPSHTDTLTPAMSRSYSRRADSLSASDDRDATVRRKKRSPDEDAPIPTKPSNDSRKSYSSPYNYPLLSNNVFLPTPTEPLKSVLRPPKLAPSAWQLYFTDWIQKQQSSGTRKLNVAQAAKEAGQEYASLTPAEKEVSFLFLFVTSCSHHIISCYHLDSPINGVRRQ